MAKVSLTIYSGRENRHGECVVQLQIAANYKIIRVPTDITVKKDHWLKLEGQVKAGKEGDPGAKDKNISLTQIKNGCDVKIRNNLEMVSKMDVKALKKFLLSEEEVVSTNFIEYCNARINHYKQIGKPKVGEMLSSAIEKLKDYNGDGNLDFNDITVSYLEKFETYCLSNKKKVNGKKVLTETAHNMHINGIAVYMRYIRREINNAIEDGLTEKYAFKKFKIKTEVTNKRNLSIEAMRAIRDYEQKSKREEIARDVFMLQFYLQGINIIDLFWMLPENLVEGRLKYVRRKTRNTTAKSRNQKVEPEAQILIDKYRGKKYLLWFADQNGVDRSKIAVKHARIDEFQYKDEEAFIKMINPNLVKIQNELKINPESKITGYWVRHSVASIASEIGISVDDISLLLGHKDPEHKITDIYRNFDILYIRADKAGRKLIDHLNQDKVQKKKRTPTKEIAGAAQTK
jgi:site-specific recombinase XerD